MRQDGETDRERRRTIELDMLGEAVQSMGLRFLIGFLGASITVSVLSHRVVKTWLDKQENLTVRNVDTLLFLEMWEFLPWIFVLLLTVVIVGVQTGRNALELSFFAIGLPAALAGFLCG